MNQKSLVQLQADYAFSLEENEAKYVALRQYAERTLRKALEVRNAISTLEMKLTKASLEYEEAIKTLDKNYESPQ